MRELEPDGADEALTAIAEAALPARGETVDQWSEREVVRLAVVGRLAGDISGAIAAHRLLADMYGTLKGGLGGKRLENDELDDLTPKQQEDAILEAAREIEAKRAEAALAKTQRNGSPVTR